MPCEIYKDPATGATMLVKCGRGRRTICAFCRRNYSTVLCDAPTSNGKTCDAPVCPACATHVPPETDYCPKHRDTQSLFGGTQ